MKKISVMTPCFNEEDNIETIYHKVREEFSRLPEYEYEHIFIDNASTDQTACLLKKIAANDHNVKVIINTRNFGHIRSPSHAFLQCYGDAVIHIVSDLQDPPELIPELIRHWEEGYKIVIGIKQTSDEKGIMAKLRRFYYWSIDKVSETEHIKNFTGFGLYDQSFVELLRQIPEPYPYLRGLVSEFGFSRYEIPYHQPLREKGSTKNNLYTLYDMAMSGFINHSKLPLRLAAFTGFVSALASLGVALFYLFYKLLYWDSFDVGVAPLVIGLFFFSSMQLLFIGIVGEYIGAIFIQVKNRPLVVEKERINFDSQKKNTEETKSG